MKTGIRVYDAMTREVISVSPKETAKRCALKMKENDIGCLMVCENNQVKGVITEQGLVHKIIAKGLNPEIVRVDKIMKKNVASVSPNKDIHDALRIMQEREIRQLTLNYLKIIEDAIREYPQQWYVFRRFWERIGWKL